MTCVEKTDRSTCKLHIYSYVISKARTGNYYFQCNIMNMLKVALRVACRGPRVVQIHIRSSDILALDPSQPTTLFRKTGNIVLGYVYRLV